MQETHIKVLFEHVGEVGSNGRYLRVCVCNRGDDETCVSDPL